MMIETPSGRVLVSCIAVPKSGYTTAYFSIARPVFINGHPISTNISQTLDPSIFQLGAGGWMPRSKEEIMMLVKKRFVKRDQRLPLAVSQLSFHIS